MDSCRRLTYKAQCEEWTLLVVPGPLTQIPQALRFWVPAPVAGNALAKPAKCTEGGGEMAEGTVHQPQPRTWTQEEAN